MLEFGYRRDLLKGPLADYIDHMRWIAAFLVAFEHVRYVLFPDIGVVGSTSSAVKIFYFLTLFGTQAVTIFFVISGLLVGGKILSNVRDNRFSLRRYASDRLTRLGIVLVPAILLSVALSSTGHSNGCSSSVPTIFGNLFFLQNVLVEPLCNNHPLWSLSNEGFYYILAPTILLTLFGRKHWGAAILGIAAFILLATNLKWEHTDILLSAPFWWVGLAPWFIRLKLPPYIPGILFIVILLISRQHMFHNPYLEHSCICLSFTLTLCSEWKNMKLGSGAWGARFSYSLYLVHMPLALLAVEFIPVLDPHKVSSYVIYGALMAGIIFVGWLFGWLFESRTAELRRLVTGRRVKSVGSS